MRECIYCGKQLEKGEVCTCAMSAMKRREKEAARSGETARSDEKREKRAEKERVRREKQEAKARYAQSKYEYRNAARGARRNIFKNAWRLFVSFVKSPIETVMNPVNMTGAETALFVIIEGIIAGLCTYSIITGASRGTLRLLGNLMGFRGVAGYGTVLDWVLSAISGALGGGLVFLIYSGVFHFMNKWIMKQFTPYRDLAKRFAFVAMPMTIIGAVGVLLGFFSQTTFAVLLLCGAIGTVVLTYEILRSMWYSKSVTKTIYTMLFCMFIFLMIVMYVIRLAVL